MFRTKLEAHHYEFIETYGNNSAVLILNLQHWNLNCASLVQDEQWASGGVGVASIRTYLEVATQ